MLKPAVIIIIIGHNNRLNCESFRDKIQFQPVSPGYSERRRVHVHVKQSI